jgi:hypothetical protein
MERKISDWVTLACEHHQNTDVMLTWCTISTCQNDEKTRHHKLAGPANREDVVHLPTMSTL